jgi:serine/threonine protein kinase/WD40 repeat protein
MSNESKCLKCGAPLTPDARDGVCPKCLLGQALAADVGASGSDLADCRAPETPVPGTKVRYFGDYELLEEIARGGMGVVYKARQVSLGRLVAVKMLIFGPSASPDFIKRFRAEASAAASLQHPNIVAVHEVGVHQRQHYLVMDLINGPPLSRLIAHQPLPQAQAAAYLKTVAEAIHYAHEHGILHRDLKPSNVLIDETDQARVTDFGLAKRIDGQSSLTITGQVMGSPNYMSPEQAAADHQNVTRRSDVYGLGGMLYHLLTGRPPFQAGTISEAVHQVLNVDPVAPRLLNPSVSLDLETICLKCLEKEPSRRYATAAAVAEELGRFLRGEPIQARPVSTPEKLQRWCRRQPVLAGLSAAVLLLLLVVAVGSTVVALKLRSKEAKTREALWHSYLSEAQLRRGGGQVGQRFRTLATLAKAAALRPTIELRNEAIKAMALPDLQERRRVECPPGASLCFDPTATIYVRRDQPDAKELSVRQVSDDRELTLFPSLYPKRSFQLVLDGRFLLTSPPPSGGHEIFQVWDVAKGTMIFQTNVAARGGPAEFRADGLAAFGQPDGHVLLYDLNQRRPVDSYAVGFPANVLQFDPRNRYLVASRIGASELLILDLREHGEIVEQLRAPGAVSGGLGWSSDGRLLAVAASGADRKSVVQVWDWTAGEPREGQILRGHQREITDLQFLSNSEFVMATSWGSTPRFWSAESGEQILLAHLTLAMGRVRSNHLAFQLTPTQFSIQEFVADKEFQTFYSDPGSAVFGAMDISPDGSLLALGASDGVRLWHPPSRTLVAVVPGAAGTVRFHPLDGSLIMVTDDRVVRWPMHKSVSGGELLMSQPEVLSQSRHHRTHFPLAVSRNGLKLACVIGEQVEIIDWRQPSGPAVLKHGSSVEHVSINSDGTLVVTAGGGFKVWDVERRQPVFESARFGYPFSSFSPDDRWLILSTRGVGGGVGGGSHQIYTVKDWQLVKEVPMDFGPWSASAFAPDGRLVALRVTESAIRLLETGSWTEIATLEAPTQDPFSWFTFSRDGSLLAVACDRHTAQLWNLRAIREQLARIGLDWNHPPYPPEKMAAMPAPRVAVDPQTE